MWRVLFCLGWVEGGGGWVCDRGSGIVGDVLLRCCDGVCCRNMCVIEERFLKVGESGVENCGGMASGTVGSAFLVIKVVWGFMVELWRRQMLLYGDMNSRFRPVSRPTCVF